MRMGWIGASVCRNADVDVHGAGVGSLGSSRRAGGLEACSLLTDAASAAREVNLASAGQAVSSSRGHRGKIARVCEPPCHPGCERPAFPRWTRRWTMSIPDSLEDELIQTVQAVVASGAISMSRHGNVSLRVPGRDELLFTAGGSLAGFDRGGVVRLALDGKIL